MRIEEMRSGRAYLARRMPGNGAGGFEPRDLEHSFPPARVEDVREERRPVAHRQSELEKNQWSVVSFDGVEAGGLTYHQATRLISALGDNGINGLCIVTDAAALNIADRPC